MSSALPRRSLSVVGSTKLTILVAASIVAGISAGGFVYFGLAAHAATHARQCIAPRGGDFTTARVFRYRPIEGGTQALASYGDGGVALAEIAAGEGRVLVWSSTLDSGWNDLALQPVFLPFMHQLTRYAAGYAPAPLWRLVGEPFDPGAVDPRAEPYTLAIGPAGDRLPVDGSRPLTLEEPGFYELRDQRTGDRGTVVAVNVDPGEAAIDSFDPAVLVSAVTASAERRADLAGEFLGNLRRTRNQACRQIDHREWNAAAHGRRA